jgi:16S rRNA U516 pseudouridylate synthase RsuA-like enzyme
VGNFVHCAEVHKEYVAKLSQKPSQKQLESMSQGCAIDGEFVKPVYVDLAGIDPSSRDRVRIVVKDGRNREVRRLIEEAGVFHSSPAFDHRAAVLLHSANSQCTCHCV